LSAGGLPKKEKKPGLEWFPVARPEKATETARKCETARVGKTGDNTRLRRSPPYVKRI